MKLTPRQRQVLCYHANGLTLVRVSKQMYLSSTLIRSESCRAKERLGATTLAQAVLMAVASGDIELLQGGAARPAVPVAIDHRVELLSRATPGRPRNMMVAATLVSRSGR